MPQIIGSGIQQPDGSWTFDWNTTKVPNGTYQICARVSCPGSYNFLGLEYSIPVEYIVDNVVPEIINLKVTPDPFSPDGSGTWVNIKTGVVYNEPGLDRVLDDIAVISFESSVGGLYDIRILDMNHTFLSQIFYGDLYPNPENNQITVEWNGKVDGSIVKDGSYIVEVRNTNEQDMQSKVFSVDKRPFITGNTVFPNPFFSDGDGYDDDTTIHYEISENSYVTIEIYQNDTLVRTLLNNEFLSYGVQNHIWDGKDDNGSYVFGSCTIKISAQAEKGAIGAPAFIDVFLMYITNIFTSRDNINPYLSDTVNFVYQMPQEGRLSFKIYYD